MNLDIIIPHCFEQQEMVERALDSINEQIKYNFKDTSVTIVNDYGAIKLNFEGSKYKFKLNQIFISKKRTLGDLRQFALDNTYNEYILFCDSDDYFLNFKMLYYFEKAIRRHNNLDIICSPYFAEHIDNDKYYYTQEDDYLNTGTLHGKIISRKFIQKYNIRFKSVNISEDASFIFSMFTLAKNSIFIEKAKSYLYTCNLASLTRKYGVLNSMSLVNVRLFTQSLVAYETYYDSVLKYLDTGVFKSNVLGASLQSTFYFFSYYKYLCKQNKDACELLKKGEKEFNRIIKKFIPYFNDKELKWQKEQILKNKPEFKQLGDIDFITYYKGIK